MLAATPPPGTWQHTAAAAAAAAGRRALAARWSSTSTSSSSSSAAVQDPGLRSAFAYCIDQVRSSDYENYVWVAQLDRAIRPAIFALRAFNVETALVPDQVRSKEPLVMQMRYQWWRDAITDTFKGAPPSHPVLLALHSVAFQGQQQQQAHEAEPSTPERAPGSSASASSTSSSTTPITPPTASTARASASGAPSTSAPSPRLKPYPFKRIIDTREADTLDPQPPLSVEGLEQYAEGTASQLLYLQLAAAGVQSRDADHAASHLGKAVGIATLLKGAAYHASRRRSYLPIDLCAQHRVSQEDVYSGTASEGLRDVVLAVASVAKGHLDEARALAARLPRAAAPLMLPALGCAAYLRALEAANFDPFHASLQGRGRPLAPLMHVLRVKYHLMRGTY